MDNEAIVMRQQMDKTLAALTEKLGELERQVTGTVKAVQGSVTTVRDSFDIKHHARRRPWTLLAGATALGLIGGLRFSGRGAASRPRNTGSANPSRYLAERSPAAPGPSWMANVRDAFQPELAELKGFAIGAALGLARDLLMKRESKPADRSLEDSNNGHTGRAVDRGSTTGKTREL